jgi:RNA recognition motif-containing protein
VPEGCPLFVGNLPFSTSWQDLKDLFRETGNVLRADIILNHDGRSKGCGTVVMETREQADNAIRMFDRYEFGGRALEVRDDKFSGGKRPPPPPPPGPRHRELQPGSYERERSPVPPIYPRAADYSGRNGDVNMDLLSPLGPPTRSRSRSRTRSPPLPRSHQQQRHHFEPEYGDQWM